MEAQEAVSQIRDLLTSTDEWSPETLEIIALIINNTKETK